MTTLETLLALTLLVAALAAAAPWLVPAARRSAVGGVLGILLGALVAAAGVVALGGGSGQLVLTLELPGRPGLSAAPDRLGGLFLVLVGVVAALASWFAIDYAHGAAATRPAWTAYPLFVVGMAVVPAAGDAVTFLLGWEVMALASTVLVAADHATRPQVRPAVLWYAVMTHLSFLLVLAGFAVLASHAGATTWTALAAARPEGLTASVAFAMLATGFAVKAGLMPFHVWLPRAHPEAPSHVSAVMSAAMVKLGLYGLLLVTTRLLPGGPQWWALALLALGLGSAAYGILQASVSSDLKRLLAYSTTENLGLMVSALAVALLLRGVGQPAVADVALTATLLLAVSHAAFKTTLFLGAGSVLHATGERDLDRLGGLAPTMPATALATSIAALGAAALPVSSGFAAEWVLLQSLVHGDTRGVGADRLVAVALPVAVAVVALTAGLALLTFVKLVGMAFLARPRSDAAAAAREGGSQMRAAQLTSAGLVVVLGLVPGWLVDRIAPAVGVAGDHAVGLAGVSLPAVRGLLDPTSLTLLALACAVPVVVATRALAGRAPRRVVELPWGCGGARVDPRMEYTATSYAEPLVRVFDDALSPTRDLRVTPTEESRYLVREMSFRQQLSDRVESAVYMPAIHALRRLGDRARAVQDGSIHRYLGFSFAALVAVLLVVTW